jgi:hypothetical protein
MASVRVYLDEDVHTFIAHALRQRGWEAVTTEALGRKGASDPDQIAYATQIGHAILTYNVQDYPRLHYEKLARGEPHAGIIVGNQDDPRRNVRALLNLLDSVSAEAIASDLVYLSNWA